jgi:inhibitor of KinA sporulation pathway (predicted exonuclease)
MRIKFHLINKKVGDDMNYIIYDLEFNQKNYNSDETINNTVEAEINNISNIPFEIIQIGALKLDANLQTISTFDSLIKPIIYRTIHPFVENLTKITNDKVASAKNFIHVYEDFLEFIGNDEFTLCVWGSADIKELVRNIKFYKLSNSYDYKYIDIQKYLSKYLKAPAKSRIGLKNAIELLNIPIEGEFHDAFNDAYYTAEVFKLIYTDDMKPITYTPAPPRRVSQPKEKIDIPSLINQFEKMYNREMSEEEISIIKLAYMMGKTRQFIL